MPKKPGKPSRPPARKKRPTGTVVTGALTPRASKGDAVIEPVTSFAALTGYWDILLNIYCAVAIEGTSLNGSVLSFKVLDPGTGTAFNNGQVFTVNLEDGDNTYPGFPATGQLMDPSTDAKYGYLLLSEDWLKKKLGNQAADYSGPKRPPAGAL